MAEASPILMDLMDTVVVDPFREVMPSFFGMTPDAFIAEKDPETWPAFERGEISEDAYFRRMFRDRRTVDRAGFEAVVRAAYRYVDGMEEVLRDLRAMGRPVHAMSNYPVWYHWIDETLGLSRYLALSFVSTDLGVRKPDREIYLRAVQDLEVTAPQCVFVDDRLVNCRAAAQVGMTALEFRDAEDLRARLSVPRISSKAET